MQAKPHVLERRLTELDFVRLQKLNASHPVEVLTDLLADADVLPGSQIDPGIVTMYTQFELEDLIAGGRRTLTICFPDDAEPVKGFISVLSPMGSSLIGVRVGEQVHWQSPSGEQKARVAAVLFQPEASGDYVT